MKSQNRNAVTVGLLSLCGIALFGAMCLWLGRNLPAHAAPLAQPDLVVTKTANATTAQVGDRITYTIFVRNTAAQTATTVVVTDAFPNGVFVSEAAAQCSGQFTPCVLQSAFVGNSYVVTASVMNMTTRLTVTLVATATQVGTSINTATALASEGDVNTPDNSASVTVTVNPPTSTQTTPDLVITKTTNAPAATVGRLLTYTLLVRNASPIAATTVVISDPLPANVQVGIVGAECAGTSCGLQLAYVGTTLVITAPEMNTSSFITVTLPITPLQAGVLVNTANVSSATPESNTVNNASTVTITVGPPTYLPLVLRQP